MKQRRFQPRIDKLEDRTVPAISWNLLDGVLTIKSDNLGATTQIDYRPGEEGKGPCIHIVGTGVDQIIDLETTPLHTVNYIGGKGRDVLTVDSTGFVFSASGNLNVNLGGGNDVANLLLNNGGSEVGVGGESLINVRMHGGSGNDNIFAQIDSIIGDLSKMNISLEGNDGHDIIRAGLLSGGVTSDATLNLGVYGQGGNDSISIFSSDAFTLAGTMNIRTDGGNGNDTITVDLLFAQTSVPMIVAPNTPVPRMNLEIVARNDRDYVYAAVNGAAEAGINATSLVRANALTKVARTANVGVVNALKKNLRLLPYEILN